MRILLLAGADEPATSLLAETLREAGHAVQLAAAPGAAELAARTGRVDAAVFDAGGAVALTELRRRLPGVPLAAWLREREDDRVAELLAAGADEVLHRGMGVREQVARIGALAERAPRQQGAVSLGGLRVDRERGEASWHGRRLGLTQRERDVLLELAAAGGETVRREALYRSVWGYAMARGDRSVDVNVKRLRDKLAAEVGAPLRIETEPGVGYRLVVAAAAVTAL
ncbi:MAG TPA: response regulator transcription factor [Gaiellaceae bacterium]|nr:response regulator transcription factor [Gaiellaceae bacterium]